MRALREKINEPEEEGHLNLASASRVSTQGDIVVQKFFEPKGPRGTYSQAFERERESEREKERNNEKEN